MEVSKNSFKTLSEPVKQFSGLVGIIILIFLTFFVLNNIFGEGDELVAKMNIAEERIAEE